MPDLDAAYHESPARPDLAPWFRSTWVSTLGPGHGGPVAIFPDTSVDLVWRAGTIRVVGPSRTTTFAAPGPGRDFLGLRFHPSAAAAWLGLPMGEIAGRSIDLEDIWGNAGRRLAQRIGEGATAWERLQLFQGLLAEGRHHVDPPGRAMGAVLEALGRGLADGPGLVRLRQDLGYSERTLRRRCIEHFGFGPKTLERVLRFQRFLTRARTRPGTGLAELAVESGYADQPHLAREARALTGMSTRTVLIHLLA